MFGFKQYIILIDAIMKKTITSLLLMLFALSLSAQNSPLKGDGSSSNPYQIKSIADLKFMSEKVNNGVESYVDKHYKLICDLEFADNADDWTPIGKGFNNPFKGTFDGGGYAIKNINIGSDGSPAPIEFAGLFGRANGATISNLTVAWKGLYVSSSSSSSY